MRHGGRRARRPDRRLRDAGGLSESVVDGVTGLLVDDLDAMTEAVDGLLRDPAARAALGAAAVEHSRDFTWARTVEAWESLLTDRAAGLPVESGTDAVAAASDRPRGPWAVSGRG